MDRNAGTFPQVGEQRLCLGGGGVGAQRPNGAAGAAKEKVVRGESHGGGSDQVQKILFSRQAAVQIRQLLGQVPGEVEGHESLQLLPVWPPGTKPPLLKELLCPVQTGQGLPVREAVQGDGQQKAAGGDGPQADLLQMGGVPGQQIPDLWDRLLLQPPAEKDLVVCEDLAGVQAYELQAVQAFEHAGQGLDPFRHGLPGQHAGVGGAQEEEAALPMGGNDTAVRDLMDAQQIPGGLVSEKLHDVSPFP